MPVILVVDDDARYRLGVRLVLERSGYTVLEADNGQSGLKELAQAAIDLVVTDIVMPVMEGIEFIRLLKKAHPELPVIAMSGGPRSDLYLDLARKMGAVAVLSKPFSDVQLLAAVAKAK